VEPKRACDLLDRMRYIGAVERGEINISLDNLERIARTLRTQLSRLFAEAEQGR
jgi:transcriptional regulator with XRE-family HTH domain